jgi:hypothetical protein
MGWFKNQLMFNQKSQFQSPIDPASPFDRSAKRSRLNRTKHLSDLYQPNKHTEAQNWAEEEIDFWPQIVS